MPETNIPHAQDIAGLIIQSQNLFYIRLSETGQYTYVNDHYKSCIIPPQLDYKSIDYLRFVHQDDLPRCLEMAEYVKAHPGKAHQITIRKFSVHQRLLYTRWTLMGLPTVAHDGACIVCAGAELSPNDVHSELLEHATSRLRTLMNSSSDQNFLLTREGQIMGFNERARAEAERVFGQRIGAGMPFIHLFKQSAAKASLEAALAQAAGGSTTMAEYQQPQPLGGHLWMRVEVMPVYNEHSHVSGISVNICNIDDLKKSQMHLEHQNRHLKEIAQMQSHHIRRPFANIKGLIDLLKMETLTPEITQWVELLDASAQQADTVIREVVAKTINARQANEK